MQKWRKLLEGYRLACRITYFVFLNINLCQQAFHVIVPICICSLHSFKLLQDISLSGWVSIFITMKQTILKLSDLKRSAAQFFWSDSVWLIADELSYASVVSRQVSWRQDGLGWPRIVVVVQSVSLVQSLSSVQLLSPLCNPMDCSMPVLHYLPETVHSYSLSQWCYLTISSSAVPFSFCLQSFPASGSFLMSQLSASCDQSIGASASASVLPVNIQGWFRLGWTGWISLQEIKLKIALKGLSRIKKLGERH